MDWTRAWVLEMGRRHQDLDDLRDRRSAAVVQENVAQVCRFDVRVYQAQCRLRFAERRWSRALTRDVAAVGGGVRWR